jgi:hypothetical protein
MLTQATHSADHCFPLPLCMGAFIAESEAAKGIVLAESAIDAFIAAHSDLNEQMRALRTLEDKLISVLQCASGDRFDVANKIIGLVDARLRTIRLSRKQTKRAEPEAHHPSSQEE